MKKIFFYILFLVILLLLPTAILLSLYLIVQKDSSYVSNSLGAFFGAFLAFSLLIVEKLVSKYYQRYRKNRNALVLLERTVNWYFLLNRDNIYLLEKFIESIESRIFYFGDFSELEINHQVFSDLYNIDLINDLFELNTVIHRNNDSLKTMIQSYKEAKGYFFDKKISKEDFDQHVSGQLPYLRLMHKSLVDADGKMEKVSARVRVLLTEFTVATMINSLVMNLFNSHYSMRLLKKYERELNVVKGERQSNFEKSSKEIEQMKEATHFK